MAVQYQLESRHPIDNIFWVLHERFFEFYFFFSTLSFQPLSSISNLLWQSISTLWFFQSLVFIMFFLSSVSYCLSRFSPTWPVWSSQFIKTSYKCFVRTVLSYAWALEWGFPNEGYKNLECLRRSFIFCSTTWQSLFIILWLLQIQVVMESFPEGVNTIGESILSFDVTYLDTQMTAILVLHITWL